MAYASGLRIAEDAGVRSNLNEALHSAAAPPLAALFASSALDPADARLRLGVGATLDDAGRGAEALEEWVGAVRLRHAALAAAASRAAFDARDAAVAARPSFRRRGKLVIAIFCDEYGQTWWPDWGPRSLERGGLGGSEEAAVFASRGLAALGHGVEVYNESPDADLGPDAHGVRWLRHATYDDASAPDVFVAWRYHVSALVVDPGSPAKVYVWLQDVPGYESWTPTFVQGLAGVFVLSDFHARTLPDHARPKAFVTPNGIDPAFLVDGENRWDRFAYGSAPNRGLYDVLKVWPRVREAIPSATLVVYYGFSPAFVKWGARNVPDFDGWRAKVEELLEQPGVEYAGMVSHETLARGYGRAGFTLYPTTYPETGCVSIMKAMALGAIPVTSRFRGSVVPELTVEFDLGPAAPRAADSAAGIVLDRHRAPGAVDEGWRAAFADAAIDAARAARNGSLDGHRRSMVAYARDRFLWGRVAAKMESHFLT